MQITKQTTFLTGKVRLTLDPPQERVSLILDYSPVFSSQVRVTNYGWNVGVGVLDFAIYGNRVYLLLEGIPAETMTFNFSFSFLGGIEPVDSSLLISQSRIESDDWAKVTPIDGYLVNDKILLRFVHWQVAANRVEWFIRKRAFAKQRKDWAKADIIRDYLLGNGIELHDDKGGTWWSRS